MQLHGIDLKGGMELPMGKPLFTRYAQATETAVALLEEDARDLQARAERLACRTREHVQSVDDPTVFIVIDELAALIAHLPDRDLTRAAEAALSVILSQGLAVGYRIVAFAQDQRMETVRMRHLSPRRSGYGCGTGKRSRWCSATARSDMARCRGTNRARRTAAAGRPNTNCALTPPPSPTPPA
ncbi:MAG TPA: hypothetical protein VFP34_16700 [Microlunatus sp.]|nr:hypothetical protein [Microlunatus sp.]